MATRKKSPEKRPKAKAPPKRSEPKAKATTTPKGKPDTKVERFKQNLRCNLAPEDLAEKADRMAHVIGERENLIAETKSATAHLKAAIKEKDAEIGKLSAQIRDKAEYREVDCERRHIYRTGKVIEVRLDTEEQTYERALTLSERQLDLPKGKPDTTQAKGNLEKALGHPVKEEDGPESADSSASNEEEKEEAADVPGSDEAPGSEEEPEDDEDAPESDVPAAAEPTGDVPAE